MFIKPDIIISATDSRRPVKAHLRVVCVRLLLSAPFGLGVGRRPLQRFNPYPANVENRVS